MGSPERAALPLAAVAAACTPYVGSTVTDVRPVAGSVGNQDFLVSTERADFVLKAGPSELLTAEVWACDRVRRAGVHAPEIVAVEATSHGLALPFLLMRRFPGRAVHALSPALVEAGRQLRLAHEISLEGYGGLSVQDGQGTGRLDRWGDVIADVTAGLEELVASRVVDDGLAAAAAAAIAAAPELRFEGRAVLLHGDLKLQHIFGSADRYVGIIDWGDACAGDPRFDLGRLSMAGPVALGAFLRGYELPLSAELDRALAAYRLVWNVDALHYEHVAGGDWYEAYREGMRAAIDSLR